MLRISMPFLRERDGRWSPEKILALALAAAPALWLAGRLIAGDLGPRPVTEAIHFSGRWSVRLLLVSLAITPLQLLLPAGRPLSARRTLGVAACLYAVAHFLLYVVDQQYDLVKVAIEIVLRFYLAMGFVALAGLIALGATSTDAAVRRLGRRWAMLHRAAYGIGVLALLHFLLHRKLDIEEPILLAGLFMWLLLYRLCRRFAGRVGLVHLLGLAVVSAALTALLEAAWYGAITAVNPLRVLEANLMLDIVIRPMWWVLGLGLAAAALHPLGQWLRPPARSRERPVRARSA